MKDQENADIWPMFLGMTGTNSTQIKTRELSESLLVKLKILKFSATEKSS